jgi:hypothetical protein
MSSRTGRVETQRARLVLNRETLRTLQPSLRGARAEAPSGQGCPTTTKASHELY